MSRVREARPFNRCRVKSPAISYDLGGLKGTRVKPLFAVIVLSISVHCYGQQDPALECQYGLEADHRFDSIKQQISLSTSDKTTSEMLADESFPNETQQRAIGMWMTEHSECQRLSLSAGAASSAGNKGLDEKQETFIWHTIEIYQGRLSFGEYNRRR